MKQAARQTSETSDPPLPSKNSKDEKAAMQKSARKRNK